MLGLRRRTAGAVVLAAALALASGGVARADKVDDLIALLSKKPGGMSTDAWREKRREAARELGRLGDKRAVEPLIKVVETEKFDAVAEIAIEALGKLGDKRAVEPLRRVYEDTARDRYVRDAAADALRRLGVDPEAPEPEPEPEPKPEPDPPAKPPGRRVADAGDGAATDGGDDGDGAAYDEPEPVTVPERSRFGRDVIAQTERWTLAVGTFAVTYDSLLEQPQASGAAATFYRRSMEKPQLGYTFEGGATLAAGGQDRDFDASDTASFALALSSRAGVETRFYLGRPGRLFAHVEGSLALGATAVTVETAMAGSADFEEFLPSTDLGLGLGVGWGRTVDVASRLRLRRIETVLRRARLLGRPISADVAARVMTAWWQLRGELGTHARLLATLQLLREAGVLLTDPDPSTVYKLLRVLEDPQLDERLEGWDARLGIGEVIMGRDIADDFEWDREETVFVRAAFGKQLPASDSEIVAAGRGFYRLTGDPDYYAISADVVYRRYFYGAAWDPRGAIQIGATLGSSDGNRDDEFGPATLVAGHVGYALFPNRASRLLLRGDVALQGDQLFVAVRLEGTWGFLANSFAAW